MSSNQNEIKNPSKISYIKTKTYQILEGDINSSITTQVISWLLVLLIISNVAAAIVASEKTTYLLYKDAFITFELISLSLFSFEYLLRVWCCVESTEYQNLSKSNARLKYIFTPVALIDLITILPFIIAMFFAIDLRTLRLIRVLRLLKLTHSFKGFNVFITVIIKESRSIVAAVMVMIFLIIIAASLMYSIEGTTQPEAFGSIINSFWWAVVTMTTVGYGDVVPITAAGKIISTFIMLTGVGLVALPAAMLAARFSEELRERKEDLDVHIKGALSKGYIDINEHQALEKLAEKLEIKPEKLQRSITQWKECHHGEKCPHCGK